MEEQILGITKLVNLLLGKPALALLRLLHIQPANLQYPIPNHIAMEFLVFLIAVVFFLWLRARLSVDKPGATQQCMEMLIHNPMSLGVGGLAGKQHWSRGRPLFADDWQHRPIRADVQPDQPGTRLGVANRGEVGSARLRHCGLRILQLAWPHQARSGRTMGSISWARMSFFRR